MPSTPNLNYPGVYVQEGDSLVRTIVPVPTAITAFVGGATAGPFNNATLIHSFADFERIFGGLSNEHALGFAVDDFFLNGGEDALVVRVAGSGENGSLGDADIRGDEAAKTGLYALKDADLFNLLVIPPCIPGQGVDAAQLDEAARFCHQRRAILLVDPPPNWTTPVEVVRHFPIRDIAARANAAVYFPAIRKANRLRDGRVEAFGPAGSVAGVIARTDRQRGVWKAPAGLDATLAGVVDLEYKLTDAENSELNSLGINCLRGMPGAGPVVWGARTLAGADQLASQWKYLPVRRTALFIEESLYRGTQWAVFEPNDEPLWAQLRLRIGAFMHDLFRAGAFQGQSPRDAYFVQCGATTTTQSDIDRGIVNVVVGFAPLKPAEFVVIYIQQIAGQAA